MYRLVIKIIIFANWKPRVKSSASSSESGEGAVGKFKSFASSKAVRPGPGGTKLGSLIIALSPGVGTFSVTLPDAFSISSAGFSVGQWLLNL